MKKETPIRWRDVKDLGFRCSNLFVPTLNQDGMFFRKKGNVILFVMRGKGGKFRLSPADSKAFDKNELSLVPPDCCNASGGRSREFSEGRDSFGIPKVDFMEEAKKL